MVHDAAQGIAQAYVPDPDAMLRDLLVQAIDTCSALAGRDPNREVVLPSRVGGRVPAHRRVPSRGRDISEALAQR